MRLEPRLIGGTRLVLVLQVLERLKHLKLIPGVFGGFFFAILTRKRLSEHKNVCFHVSGTFTAAFIAK